MKKLLAILASLSLAVGMFASCSETPDTSEGTTASTAEETTSTADDDGAADGEKTPIRMISISGDVNQDTILADFIKANIEEALPHVEMEYEPGGGGEDLANKMKTYNATDDLPDVWYSTADYAFPIIQAGNQLDFTDYVVEDDFLSNYNNSEMLKFHDGSIYTLSSGADSYFTPKIFYNMDIFAELGIEVPTTWDDFIVACDTLKAAGHTPITMMGKGGWTPQLFLTQTMAQLHDPDSIKNLLSNAGDFTDPAILAGVEKIQQLVDGGYLADGVANLDYGPAVEMFTGGNAAMLFMMSWEVAGVGTNEFAGLMDWPQMSDDVDPTDVMQFWGSPLNGYTVNANGENVDEAVEVAKFCVQQEANYYSTLGSPTNLNPELEILAPTPLMTANLEMYDVASDKIATIYLNGMDAKVAASFGEYGSSLLAGGYTAEEYIADMNEAWLENEYFN